MLQDLYNQIMEKRANQDPEGDEMENESVENVETMDELPDLTEEEVEEAINEVDNSLNAAETYIELGRELAKKDAALMQNEQIQMEE